MTEAPQTVPSPGTVVVVTGGAHGIGREYCRAFAAVGARVAVVDIDHAGADAVAREIGADALAVRADVSDESSAAGMAAAVVARFGGIDVLVNNAAMYATVPIRRVPIAELTVREWDEVMAVNLRGMFLCSRAAIPSMKARGAGRIINIASGTLFSGSGALHYATSKAGVIGFTRNLARELGPHGITVNALAPGATVTETSGEAVSRSHEATARDRAIPRPERPGDIVGAALFLASPAASFITGQTLVVDGGKVLH